MAEPGTAANHARTAAALYPRRSVRRRSIIFGMCAVHDPFPNIADRVTETKLICGKGACRRRLAFIPLAPAAVAIGVVLTDIVAPGIDRQRSGSSDVLVFSLGEQAVLFSRLIR